MVKGVKKRSTSLFPDISKQASILAGIKVKSMGSGAESLSSESGLDSSGRDLDSDYEGHGKGADDNHPNCEDADGDTGAGNHRGNGGRQLESDNEADNEQEDEGCDENGGKDLGDEIAGDDDDCEMLELEGSQVEHESDLTANELTD